MSDAPSIRVTINDVRVLRYCSGGSRAMCARLGIDWMSFLQHGVDVERLEPVEDEMIQALVAVAKQRAERE